VATPGPSSDSDSDGIGLGDVCVSSEACLLSANSFSLHKMYDTLRGHTFFSVTKSLLLPREAITTEAIPTDSTLSAQFRLISPVSLQ
jgi:hypothetical protein